jgi:DNA-binding PadR family transcriptional regulator
MTTTNPTPPLTPAVFHILLALSNVERHGYGIMKQVEADAQGKVTMGTGTLYGSLKRMLEAGLVEESDKRVDPEMDAPMGRVGTPPSDARRIYYRITDVGAKALAEELARYNRIVTLAQERKLYPKTYAYDV